MHPEFPRFVFGGVGQAFSTRSPLKDAKPSIIASFSSGKGTPLHATEGAGGILSSGHEDQFVTAHAAGFPDATDSPVRSPRVGPSNASAILAVKAQALIKVNAALREKLDAAPMQEEYGFSQYRAIHRVNSVEFFQRKSDETGSTTADAVSSAEHYSGGSVVDNQTGLSFSGLPTWLAMCARRPTKRSAKEAALEVPEPSPKALCGSGPSDVEAGDGGFPRVLRRTSSQLWDSESQSWVGGEPEVWSSAASSSDDGDDDGSIYADNFVVFSVDDEAARDGGL